MRGEYTLLIIRILFLLVLAHSVSAMSYHANWNYNCNGCCVEGKEVQFSIELENDVTDHKYLYGYDFNYFFVDAIKIEKKSGITFATLGKIDDKGWNVHPGDTIDLNIVGTLEKPNSGTTLYYKPCFYVWYPYSGSSGAYYKKEWSCVKDYHEMEVIPKTQHKCDSDNDCSINEYCMADGCVTWCKPVVHISNCGYVDNHEWVQYDCCQDDDCVVGICQNHDCIQVTTEKTTIPSTSLIAQVTTYPTTQPTTPPTTQPRATNTEPLYNPASGNQYPGSNSGIGGLLVLVGGIAGSIVITGTIVILILLYLIIRQLQRRNEKTIPTEKVAVSGKKELKKQAEKEEPIIEKKVVEERKRALCSKCSKELKENAKFCRYCGSKV